MTTPALAEPKRAPQLASLTLLIIYISSEKICETIGGDTGAFLYTTNHFILMPILSIILLAFLAILFSRKPLTTGASWLALSATVPLGILFIAITGNPIMFRILNINFNK